MSGKQAIFNIRSNKTLCTSVGDSDHRCNVAQLLVVESACIVPLLRRMTRLIKEQMGPCASHFREPDFDSHYNQCSLLRNLTLNCPSYCLFKIKLRNVASRKEVPAVHAGQVSSLRALPHFLSARRKWESDNYHSKMSTWKSTLSSDIAQNTRPYVLEFGTDFTPYFALDSVSVF